MANFGYKKMFDLASPEVTDEHIDKLNKLATIMSGRVKFLDAGASPGIFENLRRMLRNFLNFFTDNAVPLDSQPTPIPAGYTYLAQFIGHDISHDEKSDREKIEHRPWNVMEAGLLAELKNFRNPACDLDTIYGYEQSDVSDEFPRPTFEPFRHELMQNHPLPLLKLGATIRHEGRAFPCDLPRKDGDVTANIVDPRNDENLLLAQTQVAFIKFHNAMVAKLSESAKYRTESGEYKKKELFDKARKLVIRYYQTIIMTDFLPKIIQESVLQDVKTKAGTDQLFYQPQSNGMFIPLEFTVAAFRFGHSMIRGSYDNFNRKQSSALLDNIMTFTGRGKMNGLPGKKLPGSWIINWHSFYEINNVPPTNMAEPINTALVLALLQLRPHFKKDNTDGRTSSMAALDLFRGRRFGLPTGQAVAEKINAPILDLRNLIMGKVIDGLGTVEADEIKKELADFFSKETPLWFYILAEAELQRDGKLGAVGSRIVAETIIQILYYSEYSVLQFPTWETQEGEPDDGFLLNTDGTFGMPEMLKFIKQTSEEHFSLLYPNMTQEFDELNPLG